MGWGGKGSDILPYSVWSTPELHLPCSVPVASSANLHLKLKRADPCRRLRSGGILISSAIRNFSYISDGLQRKLQNDLRSPSFPLTHD